MTSKSRLGKGLGALFPALPGESKTAHAEQQQLGVDLESEETTANKKALKRKLRLHQRRSNPIRAVLNNTVSLPFRFVLAKSSVRPFRP